MLNLLISNYSRPHQISTASWKCKTNLLLVFKKIGWEICFSITLSMTRVISGIRNSDFSVTQVFGDSGSPRSFFRPKRGRFRSSITFNFGEQESWTKSLKNYFNLFLRTWPKVWLRSVSVAMTGQVVEDNQCPACRIPVFPAEAQVAGLKKAVGSC